MARHSGQPHGWLLASGLLLAILFGLPGTAVAQAATGPWGTAIQDGAPASAATAPSTNKADPAEALPGGSNTTVIPRNPGDAKAASGPAQVQLVALLTADGQRIDQGIVWRVFQEKGAPGAKNKLIATYREASPALKLQPGDYIVNAAFGRAHITRKITIKPGASALEPFVLNAGGLRLSAKIGNEEAAANTISYNIYTDERDQFNNRAIVMSGARPGLIIRLNAGIYHIVSTYGDANATVQADVTVEAGKLTEATVAHAAGKVTFKLVTRSGGEALPDTHWTIQTPQGEIVKESVGALPTHILAPGTYNVVAKSGSRAFRRDLAVQSGDVTQLEVVIQ